MTVRLAAHFPEFISDLVLVASAHSFSAEGIARVHRQIAFASEGRYEELVEEFGGLFRRPWLNWLLSLSLLVRRRKLAAEVNTPEYISSYLSAGLSSDGTAGTRWLNGVGARTLVIGGSRDQFFGQGRMEETAMAIPGCHLTLLRDETHMAPLECSRLSRLAISKFLQMGSAPTVRLDRSTLAAQSIRGSLVPGESQLPGTDPAGASRPMELLQRCIQPAICG